MSTPEFSMQALAYACGRPRLSGILRQQPEDFRVDEVLGFELTGEGEHLCLHIQKRNANTADVANRIARLVGVKRMDVSYAGLKDRYAVTTQWFSVYLSNKPEPDWQQLESEEIKVLSLSRHNRKLRRGALKGNRFRLLVRELTGDRGDLLQRLEKVKTTGVPNYFGEQRFGHANLERAEALFEGRINVRDRNKRSLYLSAARSAIFNTVLSQRVDAATWTAALAGDLMMLSGSNSVFMADTVDDALKRRVESRDIFPTGPLWGKGSPATQGRVGELEREVGEAFGLFAEGLARAGMKQERRALVLMPEALQWSLSDDCLELAFSLTSGSYATSLLREVVTC